MPSIIPLCHRSLPSTIPLSSFFFVSMVFSLLPLHCALPLPLFFPIYYCFLPSIEPLSPLPLLFAITLCHLPSLSLPSHHTFSFLGLGFSLFPCAKNHSHLPLFPQVFFFLSMVFSSLPLCVPLCHCFFPSNYFCYFFVHSFFRRIYRYS